jgi:uncharacterized membrane protein
MEIVGYIIVGFVFLIALGCAVTPLILDKMSKEERDAAGIVWKEDN